MRSGLGTALVAAALCLAGGCKREPAEPQVPGTSAVAPAAADSGVASALTREQVDRFVKYQSRLVELYDQVLSQREREKAAPIARLTDGGVADPVKVSLQLFQGKAKAEEAARAEAGLSLEDIRRIEPIVAGVINERSNARADDVAAVIKQLQALRDKLPEEKRQPVEDQIREVEEDHRHRDGNVEQRQEYGDAAVDAVLTREADLTRLRTEWVKRIGALGR